MWFHYGNRIGIRRSGFLSDYFLLYDSWIWWKRPFVESYWKLKIEKISILKHWNQWPLTEKKVLSVIWSQPIIIWHKIMLDTTPSIFGTSSLKVHYLKHYYMVPIVGLDPQNQFVLLMWSNIIKISKN